MTTKTYEADTHIFYSNNSNDDIIHIKPKTGQTLLIDGTLNGNNAAGVDLSVQFNSLGDLSGDSNFLYDTITGELIVPSVNTDFIDKKVTSNSLDYSPIYNPDIDGTSFPTAVASASPGNFNFGTDVEISYGAKDSIIWAAPNYVLGASTGSAPVFDRAASVFSETTQLVYSNFTLEATVGSASVDESSVYYSLCANDQLGYIYIFKRALNVFTEVVNNADLVYHQAKMTLDSVTGNVTVLSVDHVGSFHTSELTPAGVYTPAVQNIYDSGIAFGGFQPMAISDNFILLNIDGVSNYFKKTAGTWASVETLTGAANFVDIVSIGSSYISAIAKASGFVIKGFYGTQTFGSTKNYSCCTLTDAIAFAYNSTDGVIEIYVRQSPSNLFTKSVNDYTIAGITSMSTNGSYLACGHPGDNYGSIFKVLDTYANHDVEISKINMNAGGQIEMTASGGVDISNDLIVNGKISVIAAATDVPDYEFNVASGNGFHYSSTGEIRTLINFTDKFSVANTFTQSHVPLKVPIGSAAAPSLVWDNDLNCGFYHPAAENIALAISGVKAVDYTATGTTFTNKIVVPAGSVSAPGLTIGSAADTGIIKNVNSLNLVTDGVVRLGTDYLHTVSTIPFRTLNDGSAATPSFGFVNYMTSGMFVSATGVAISVAGTKQLEISSGGYTRSDSFTGLTAQTNVLNLGTTGTSTLVMSGATKAAFALGGNSLTTASFGNNCSTTSNNPTLGSIIRVDATGNSRWGGEFIVSGGTATQFIVFLSDTTGVGSVTTNFTTTSYNTTSSRLLKKDITAMDSSIELERINLLKPSKYKWKANDEPGESFIADELEEVFPACVCGTDTEKDGRMDYKQVDTTHLIASLVSAVQELTKQNDLLKTEIAAIKLELATFV